MSGGCVLIIEDNDLYARFLVRTVQAEGFVVEWASTGAEGVKRAPAFDAFVVDWHLPDMTGDMVVRQLRRTVGKRPIIVVSGDEDEDVEVQALRAGADDMASKHRARAVAARLKHLLRPVPRRSGTRLSARAVVIDRAERCFILDGEAHHLPARELEVLEALLEAGDSWIPSRSLAERVWRAAAERNTNILHQRICALRKSLTALGAGTVENQKGAGYRLVWERSTGPTSPAARGSRGRR